MRDAVLTGYAGAAVFSAGERAGGDRRAWTDPWGGGGRARQEEGARGLGSWWGGLPRTGTSVRMETDAGGGGSSAERRASWCRRTRGWRLDAIWVGGRARPAPAVLDAGLLGLAAARLEARAGAAPERESAGGGVGSGGGGGESIGDQRGDL
jgi:hypothetical protein